MTMGAPVKYKPEELQEKIVEYFLYVEEINKQRKLKRFEGEKLKPYTVTGLCVFLEISRETLNEYSKKNEYAETVRKAKIIIENYVEEGLLNGAINTIGGIFNLKNNFGWVDKFDVSTSVQSDQLDAVEIKKLLNGS